MGRTIRFYHLAIFRNDVHTDVSFLEILDQISRDKICKWENRIRKINKAPTGLFDMELKDEYPHIRIFPLGKFREDYKPYIGHPSTPKLSEIKPDVVELVTVLYDSRLQTIAMEYNQNGLREKGFQDYFNSFLPQEKGNHWYIKLIPINSNKGVEDIEKSSEVRSIEISLKLDKFREKKLQEGLRDNTRSEQVLSFLWGVRKTDLELESKIVRLEFGVGPGQNLSMNIDSVLMLLNALDFKDEYINSLKVKYREVDSDKLHTTDLKNFGGILKDRILENETIKNPGWQYIGDNMLELYEQYSNIINDSFKEFVKDRTTVNSPKLILVPREENKVELQK